jgi:hypothetical protein
MDLFLIGVINTYIYVEVDAIKSQTFYLYLKEKDDDGKLKRILVSRLFSINLLLSIEALLATLLIDFTWWEYHNIMLLVDPEWVFHDEIRFIFYCIAWYYNLNYRYKQGKKSWYIDSVLFADENSYLVIDFKKQPANFFNKKFFNKLFK